MHTTSHYALLATDHDIGPFVDLWQIPLLQPAEVCQELQALLTPDELTRAMRYRFEQHQRRFLVARAALRMILSGYLQCAVQDLQFQYNPHGKPNVQQSFNTSPWEFNLSHSGEQALLAVTRIGPVGVDLEQLRPRDSLGELARRYFASAEVQVWQALPVEQQLAGFFAAWTRKEAYLKAQGHGLTLPLDSFVVSLAPGAPAELLATMHDPAALGKWRLHDLPGIAGYAAALVTPAVDCELRWYEWKAIPSE